MIVHWENEDGVAETVDTETASIGELAAADFALFMADKGRGSRNVPDREREALTNAIVAYARGGDKYGDDDANAEDDLETLKSDALNQIDSAIADLEAARARIPKRASPRRRLGH